MGIYRGAGGSGDAVNDASSEALLTLQAKDAAITAQIAAEAARTAAELAETNAETAETNAETAETNAETAATNAANSASAASTSATNAASSASAASTSASNASTSATNAASSASAASTSASNAASSASSASTSASTATTQATNASTSASAAATSATNSASSATAAAGSATNAASSATSASGSASTATTQATNASNSASAASTSASNAASSASAASTSASNAATSATNASNSASAAATSATNASNSASAAATSATAASNAQTAAETARDQTLTAYDNFDDRYLGAKTSDPTLDNDGNALVAGALYFNSTGGFMKVYTGSVWVDAYAAGSSFLAKANNLSDLPSASTARTNLGLAIGTNVQAYDADLAAIAALSPTLDNFIVGSGTAWIQETPSQARTSLGATTVGSNLFTLTNPSAVTFPRFNADNTVSSLDASTFRTAIGAGTGNGSVTSITAGTGLSGGTITTSGTVALANTAVTAGSYTYTNLTVDAQGRITAASSGTAPVTSVSGTSPIASSGGTTPAISLASGYGDTQNPYASKTANFVLAAPNGTAGTPSFRALVAADIPTLNQNTTGTAGGLTGTPNITVGTIAATSITSTTTNATNSISITDTGTSGANLRLAGNGATTPNKSIRAFNGNLAVVNSGYTAEILTLSDAGALTVSGNVTANGTVLTGNTGTVTSVGGTGSVNGITLSGTVTSSGNLTLGGTLSNVSLSTQVTGTLPIANGGTGQTTASAAFDALNPMTTTGDLIYEASGGVSARLPIGSTGQVLTVSGGLPTWAAAGGSGFPSGTVMLFAQTSAPTGWTKNTTTGDNSALRVTTGAVGSGGSVGFTTAFASQTPTISITGISGSAGATTITTSTMPSHTHSHNYAARGFTGGGAGDNWVRDGAGGFNTGSTGGDGSHTHPFSFTSGTATSSAINLAVQYIDVIRASKD